VAGQVGSYSVAQDKFWEKVKQVQRDFEWDELTAYLHVSENFPSLLLEDD